MNNRQLPLRTFKAANSRYFILAGFFLAAVSFNHGLSAQEEESNSVVNETLIQTNQEAERQAPGAILDNLEMQDMGIYGALKLISEQSGLSIMADDGLEGSVTIFLKSIDAREALHIILETNNLAYMEEEDVIKVMTKEAFLSRYGYPFGKKMKSRVISLLHADAPELIAIISKVKSPYGTITHDTETNSLVLVDTESELEAMTTLIKELDVPIETKTFKLKFARVENILEDIHKVITKDVGQVKSDDVLNTITITDTGLKIKEIEQLIVQLDQQDQKITVETKIIQIILNDEHPQGVDWEAIVTDYQSLSFLGFAYNRELGSAGRLSLGIISEEDYAILLEALDTVGAIHNISNAKVSTAENQTSQIKVKSTDVSFIAQEDSANIIEREEEINFHVKPKVHKEDFFELIIKPEVVLLNHSQNRIVYSNGNGNTKKEALVEVGDGATIVIGSLFNDVTIESTRKIPFLGDLPFVGSAFSRQGESLAKTEVIVFITPRVVKE